MARIVTAGLLPLVVLASPATASEVEPICADRPGMATDPCTVPAGVVQVETGFFEWTHDRSERAKARELTIGETAFIFGVTDNFHIELSVSLHKQLRLRDGDLHESDSGFGDLVMRTKYRLTREGAPVEVAAGAFVKVPTAKRPLGNGKVEAGIVIPVEWEIPNSTVSVTLSPELNLLADSDGSGHHPAVGQAISLEAPLSSRLTLALDLWREWNWDPAGTVQQYAVGPSASYLISNDIQIDAGVDLGLNRHTSDVTVSAGVAARF